MPGKRRRDEGADGVKKALSEEPSSANGAAQAPDDLPERFSQLFGIGGGSTGFTGLFAGVSSSGSSSIASPTPRRKSAASATPAVASRAPAPLQRTAVASSAVRSASSGRGGDRQGSDGGTEVAEEKRTKRLSEEELREREKRTLFVGNVPLKWSKCQLRRVLRAAVGDKYAGQFKPIWFRAEPVAEKYQGKLRKVGSIKGEHASGAANAKNAYVVLTSSADVTQVRHAVHSHTVDGHVLRADGVGAAAQLQTFDRKRSIFVGNLPPSTSEADLRGVFAPAGQVDAVRVVRDRVAKACKGFAFVRFKDRASVKAAINLWGAEIQGRPVRVMKVTQQEGDENGGASSGKDSHPAAQRIAKKSWRRGTGAPRKPKKPKGFAKNAGASAKGMKAKKEKLKVKKVARDARKAKSR